MNRYAIQVEVTKAGRKKETQYAVFDSLEGRVVVRYAKESDAQGLIDRYELSVKA